MLTSSDFLNITIAAIVYSKNTASQTKNKNTNFPPASDIPHPQGGKTHSREFIAAKGTNLAYPDRKVIIAHHHLI